MVCLFKLRNKKRGAEQIFQNRAIAFGSDECRIDGTYNTSIRSIYSTWLFRNHVQITRVHMI